MTIDSIKEKLHFLENYHKTEQVYPYPKLSIEEIHRELFGPTEFVYFYGLKDSKNKTMEILHNYYGIIFNERFAYLFSCPEKIWIVKSEKYFNEVIKLKDYSKNYLAKLPVLYDVCLVCESDELDILKFSIMNCDKISSGWISIWDYFFVFGLHDFCVKNE